MYSQSCSIYNLTWIYFFTTLDMYSVLILILISYIIHKKLAEKHEPYSSLYKTIALAVYGQ